MLPLATGLTEGAEYRKSMGTVIIGGLTSSLLLTLVLLFGLQGEQIMRQPLVILLLAVPIAVSALPHSRAGHGWSYHSELPETAIPP